jgi:carboxymethylenebutenolidase
MCFDNDSRPPLPPIRGSALDARELTLTSRDGTRFAAYAATPDAPSGAGIVIVPDVRGLHPYYEELVLRFAEAGVHAIAVDLYARTAGGEKRGDGFEYEPHVLKLDPDAVNDDVAAAATDLRDKVERLYTIGFCLGGRVSLLQAATGLGVTGVIGLYPWPVGPHRSGIPAPADEAPRFDCPVLSIYGGADAAIPVEQQEAFDRALESAGVEHRTVVYEGAPHSFFDRKAADHAEASAAAWEEILRFMAVTD